MKNIQHARLALRDLDQIWDYIARDNPVAADRFIDKVQAKSEMLARPPAVDRRVSRRLGAKRA